jgi:hypothetical protein
MTLPLILSEHGTPQVIHYGPVYNIGTASNINTGPNYGKHQSQRKKSTLTGNLFRNDDHDFSQRRDHGTS